MNGSLGIQNFIKTISHMIWEADLYHYLYYDGGEVLSNRKACPEFHKA